MAVIVNPMNQPQSEQEKGQNSLNPLQTVGTAAPSGQAPSGSPMANQAANTLAQRQGSGRFTNLQKYLQANKQGAQQVSSQIGQNINKNITDKQQKAEQYYTQLGQNIDQANQTAQQGRGFQTQLQNLGSTIQSAQQAGFNERNAQQQNLNAINQFTESPDFQRFQDIQAGRAIDESLLSLQQQRALNQAQQAQRLAQESQQMLGSEGGRFDLLRKTFGGGMRPEYSQGQQRLDQVLLGQGGGLGQVQANVTRQMLSAQEKAKLAADKQQEVNRIRNQEAGLISGINEQAGLNEEAYLKMLGSYVDPLNQQRQAEWNQLNTAIADYKPDAVKAGESAANRGLTNEQLARLGVTQEMGAFDVLQNLADANAVARQGRQAQGFQDVASQSDVDRYAALSKIMNQRAEDKRLTQAGNLGEAYTAAEGDSNLAKRLESAQKVFDERMGNQNFARWYDGNRLNPQTNLTSFYQGGAKANAQDLFNQNQAAINSWAQGDASREQRLATNTVWNDFKNWLDEQNYSRTIGGNRSTAEDIYGRRATAGGLTTTAGYQDSGKKGTDWKEPLFANTPSAGTDRSTGKK